MATAQQLGLTTLKWNSVSAHLQLESVRDLLSAEESFGFLSKRQKHLERETIDGAKLWRVTSGGDAIRDFGNGAGPCGLCPPCPQPSFCLWKNFSQGISLIREVRKCRNKGKPLKETK